MEFFHQMAIFLIIAYLFSKSPAFKPLMGDSLLFKHKALLYLIFSGFAIFGTYVGVSFQEVIANISTVGIILAGLVAGPGLGIAVGVTSGLYDCFRGDFSSLTLFYGASAVFQGVFGGLLHLYFSRRGKIEQVFNPTVAILATLAGVIFQLIAVFIFSKTPDFSWNSLNTIVLPTLLGNAIGAGLFMIMMRDQRVMRDKVGAMFSAKALNIAERSLGIFGKGFNETTARQLAEIIYDETGVGAVSISDCDKILAFVGEGSDHHFAGLKIISPQTMEAIRENKVIYADGVREHFTCALSDNCPLGSTLIVPLREDNDVVGTIKLYEPKHKLFLNLNKALGEGIAKILSEQLLRHRYGNQKNLLVKSELKLIEAQVNPHFLFNALNTIVAVVRVDPDQARSLLLHLSNYFRKNLKRSSGLATLEEELNHVNSYLVIQKARFGEKLSVEQEIEPELLKIRVPAFTLQPIIENAVKHGISNMLGPGIVRICGYRDADKIVISIEDNAGAFCEKLSANGLGMNIVDKRIKNYFGSQYGTKVSCVPDEWTKVSIVVPSEKGNSACSER